jgi:hypothetical protein
MSLEPQWFHFEQQSPKALPVQVRPVAGPQVPVFWPPRAFERSGTIKSVQRKACIVREGMMREDADDAKTQIAAETSIYWHIMRAL